MIPTVLKRKSCHKIMYLGQLKSFIYDTVTCYILVTLHILKICKYYFEITNYKKIIVINIKINKK